MVELSHHNNTAVWIKKMEKLCTFSEKFTPGSSYSTYLNFTKNRSNIVWEK